jgi:DNA-binding response OmpR family regulator
MQSRISLQSVSTIVVASDAPSVRAEVIGILEERGTELIEVNDGARVASVVSDHEPDLVLVDLQMGNMGGMAVCMDLRLEESYGNLPYAPVLMLLDRRADVFLARRSGAEGWIVKPMDPLRLRRATEAILAGGTYHDRSFEPIPSSVAVPPPPRDGLPAQAPSDSTALAGPAAPAQGPATGGSPGYA